MKKLIISILASAVSFASLAQAVSDTLRMDEILKSPVLSIDEALAGRVSGLSVSFFDDSPGRMAIYRYRGLYGYCPLFVVDGMRADQAFVQSLNPSQIESIVVLSDIAATSRYGSEGASGVIEIMTRNGSYGKVKVNADALAGANILSAKSLAGTDYSRDAVKNALLHNYNVSVSGGSKNAGNRFIANLGYLGDGGVLKGTSFNRIQGNLRYEQALAEKLTFYLSAAYRSTVRKGIETDSPYADYILGDNGPDDYYGPDAYIMYHVLGKGVDPVPTLDNAFSKSVNSYITGIAGLEWNIVRGLVLKLRGSYNALNTDDRDFNNKKTLYGSPDAPYGMNINASALAGNINRYDGEVVLSYSDKFASGSGFSANAGFLARGESNRYRGERSYGMTTEALGAAALNTGTYIPVKNFDSKYGYLQVYLNAMYSIKGRYDIFASLSADSFNGVLNAGWKFLPSFGLAWNFAREAFAENGSLSSGRLSVSWGKAGYSEPYSNPELVILRPYVSKQFDAAISFGLWKDRLCLKAGYYDINLEGLRYNGAEFGLKTCPVRNDKVKWSIFANAAFTFGENKMNFGGAGTMLEAAGFDFSTNLYWNPDCFRCANVTAGYTFGRNLMKACSMRVFVNAGNIGHRSLYNGWDFDNDPAYMSPGRFRITGGFSLEF